MDAETERMYLDWPHKGTARLFVYPDGTFGACVDN